MSIVALRKCPVERCYYNKHPVYADKQFTRNHIHHHDYREKLETACKLGLIDSTLDRRSPQWLDEMLTDSSMEAS